MNFKKMVLLLMVLALSVSMLPAKSAKWYVKNGNMYYKKSETWDRALEMFEEAVKKDSTLFEAYKKMADIHHARNEYVEAMNFYTKALDLYNNQMATAGKGDKEDLIEDFGEEMEKAETFRKDAANQLFKAGYEKYQAKDWQGAVDQLASLDITDDQVKVNQAKILMGSYSKLENNPEFIKWAKVVTELDSTDTASRSNLAANAMQAKDYAEARKWYQQIVDIEKNSQNLFNLGLTYYLQQEGAELESAARVELLDNAYKLFDEAITVDPTNTDAIENMAVIAAIAAQNSAYDKALDWYKHLNELRPNNAEYLTSIFIVYNTQKDYAGLIEFGQAHKEQVSKIKEAVQLMVYAAGQTKNDKVKKEYTKIFEGLSKK